MPPFDDYTWSEIQSQPQAWAATLELLGNQAPTMRAFLASQPFEQVMFTGCGSTYYLSLAAAAGMREIGRAEATGQPASEIWLNPQTVFPTGRRVLLVAVSRSGETTETVRAVEAFRAAGRGPVLTISCYADRPLARMGDLNLVIHAGQEHSIAQTRAFSTLYIATLYLAALVGQRADLLGELGRLPAAGQQVLSAARSLAHELGTAEQLQRCFFLGSGARYGLAAELSLKMKEMSLSESEPFHFLEYRHGPQSMANPGTLILGLLSDTNQAHESAVLNDMRAHGARCVALGARAAEVALEPIDELVRGPLYLPFGQMLAYERAIWRGLTPDRPHQLSAVVKLDAS
jgi:glucosamine--fructose-6-phosphate aminotransferase (isomerizing)